MKNCLLVLVAGVMLCVPFGCDSRSDEDPVAYDRDVDGPPAAIKTPLPDYDIIGSPSVVRDRRQAFRESSGDTSPPGDTSGGGEDLTGPAVDASEDEIAEVKTVIQKVLDTKDAEDDSAAMAFFDEDAATAVKEIMQGVKDIKQKALALDSTMETKFGAQYPEGVKANNKKMRTKPMGPSSAAEMLGEISMNQLVFKKIGEKIVATSSKNDKFVLSKTADGWKIGFDKKGRKRIDICRELQKGAAKMLDTLSAGVDDGSITADTVEGKAAELTKEHVAPAQKKLKAMSGDADADTTTRPADGGGATTTPDAGGDL